MLLVQTIFQLSLLELVNIEYRIVNIVYNNNNIHCTIAVCCCDTEHSQIVIWLTTFVYMMYECVHIHYRCRSEMGTPRFPTPKSRGPPGARFTGFEDPHKIQR